MKEPTTERLLDLLDLADRLDLVATKDKHLFLLHQALTTAAWAKCHGGLRGDCPYNEWLEWYGDAVWNHAAVELTLETFPGETRLAVHEGWRMRLKSGERQTRLARTLGLEPLLLLPQGYKPVHHGKKMETSDVLLGSALEAVIGAVATWSIRDAVRIAKNLMRALLRELPLMSTFYVQSVDRDRELNISSCEQLRGYTRLSIFVTREIMGEEDTLTLKGAWHVRLQTLSVRVLGVLGRRANLANTENTDMQSMQRLLAAAGKGEKLNASIKQALQSILVENVASIKNAQAYREPSHAQEPTRNPVGELRTLLNGHATLLFESRSYGSGHERGIHTQCFVNGHSVGEGIDRDGRVAQQRAAEAALNNPTLGEARRSSR